MTLNIQGNFFSSRADVIVGATGPADGGTLRITDDERVVFDGDQLSVVVGGATPGTIDVAGATSSLGFEADRGLMAIVGAGEEGIVLSDAVPVTFGSDRMTSVQIGGRSNGTVEIGDGGALNVRGSIGASVQIGGGARGSVDIDGGSTLEIDGGSGPASLSIGVTPSFGRLSISNSDVAVVGGAGASVSVEKLDGGSSGFLGLGIESTMTIGNAASGGELRVGTSNSNLPRGNGASVCMQERSTLTVEGAVVIGADPGSSGRGSGRVEVVNSVLEARSIQVGAGGELSAGGDTTIRTAGITVHNDGEFNLGTGVKPGVKFDGSATILDDGTLRLSLLTKRGQTVAEPSLTISNGTLHLEDNARLALKLPQQTASDIGIVATIMEADAGASASRRVSMHRTSYSGDSRPSTPFRATPSR